MLTPLAVDPAHPFPFMSNLSLNVAALIRDPDTGQQQFARVKVPTKTLPRFVEIPTELCTREPSPVYTAVPLEQVVAFNLQLLFPGMTIEGHYFFRITRDADLELRDLEADDLMEALQEGLRKRRRGGEVVRLEVANEMPDEVVDLLMEGTDVDPADLYRVNGPLGLDDLMSLLAIPLPQLKDKPHQGRTVTALARAQQQPSGGWLDQGGGVREHLRGDPPQRCAAPTPLRPLRHLGGGVPQPGRRRPLGAGHQDDPLPHLKGFAGGGGPDPRRRERQAGDGPGGAQSPLR